MGRLAREVFTFDNFLHSVVAVAFVITLNSLLLWAGWYHDFLAWIFTILAAVGLYLREVSQVDWDFTLEFSLHKHMEWFVGAVCAFVITLICVLAT